MIDTKPFAFILMPFAAEFDDVYRIGIQEAALQAGIFAERVDEQRYFSHSILGRIQQQIESADIIIADMSGRNPNVFYEVGYAHAKNKKCVLLTRSTDDIPFDLKHHRHIIYNNSLITLRKELTDELSWFMKEREKEIHALELEVQSYASLLWPPEWASSDEFSLKTLDVQVNVRLTFNLRNGSGEILEVVDYIKLYSNADWDWKQSSMPCPVSMSDNVGYRTRTSIFPSFRQIPPAAWARITVEGSRTYPRVPRSEIGKLSVPLKGRMMLRVDTIRRVFELPVILDLVAERVEM